MPDDFETPPAMPAIGFTPRMRAHWEDVLDWLVDHRPVGGLGGPLPDADGRGKRIDRSPAGINPAQTLRPWQAALVAQPSGPPKIGINPYSYAAYSSDPEDSFTITGFPASWPPTQSDSALLTCPNVGELLWCRLDVSGLVSPDSGSITGEIQSDADDDWGGYPDPVTIDDTSDPDNPIQSYYYLAIAIVVDPTDERPGQLVDSSRKLVQLFSRNVTMFQRDRDSLLIWEPGEPALDFDISDLF